MKELQLNLTEGEFPSEQTFDLGGNYQFAKDCAQAVSINAFASLGWVQHTDKAELPEGQLWSRSGWLNSPGKSQPFSAVKDMLEFLFLKGVGETQTKIFQTEYHFSPIAMRWGKHLVAVGNLSAPWNALLAALFLFERFNIVEIVEAFLSSPVREQAEETKISDFAPGDFYTVHSLKDERGSSFLLHVRTEAPENLISVISQVVGERLHTVDTTVSTVWARYSPAKEFPRLGVKVSPLISR